MKTLISSFLLAFHNIRSHFFHTLLSVLGIVIGVAALVSILSLIDGMEQVAREQITKTTSLNTISVVTNAYSTTNGIRVKKDSLVVLSYDDYREAAGVLSKPCAVHFLSSFNDAVELVDTHKKVGAIVFGMGSPALYNQAKVIEGRLLTDEEFVAGKPVALVNLKFLHLLDSTMKPKGIIGKTLQLRDKTLTVESVFEDDGNNPRVIFPLSLMSDEELHTDMPLIVIDAAKTEDVNQLAADVTKWVNDKFGVGNFNIAKNTERVEQAAKGFLLFRVVMGLIVGISVLVGGIGIMNVLLISITERTVEIGIRKAVGANRRDIILQFLAESVTVSVFGSAMGLILGILGTMAIIPIVVAITNLPFMANYTANTLLIVSVLAVLLGVIFGTYPAIRASRLDPVEAIRHE